MTTATKERIINKVESLSESDALMVLDFIDDIQGRVPDAETIKAIEESYNPANLIGPFDNMKDFMKSLLSDDERAFTQKSGSAFGSLNKYANPELMPQEKSAWEQAMFEKYADR